jgi:hypothetical protein
VATKEPQMMNRRNALLAAGGLAAASVVPALASPSATLLTFEDTRRLLEQGWFFQVWLDGELQSLVVGFDQCAGWVERCRTTGPWGQKAPFFEPVHGDWNNWHEDDESRLATEKVYGFVTCHRFRDD